MEFKLITPQKGIEINEKEIYLLEAEGINGNFGILDKHIDCISALKDESVLSYKIQSDSPVKEVKIREGILEVHNYEQKTEIKVIALSIAS